jgi:histidine ammonia-lyase
MLLRVNSHLRGASGIGWPLIERLLLLLRRHATPVVQRCERRLVGHGEVKIAPA